MEAASIALNHPNSDLLQVQSEGDMTSKYPKMEAASIALNHPNSDLLQVQSKGDMTSKYPAKMEAASIALSNPNSDLLQVQSKSDMASKYPEMGATSVALNHSNSDLLQVQSTSYNQAMTIKCHEMEAPPITVSKRASSGIFNTIVTLLNCIIFIAVSNPWYVKANYL